MSAVHLDAVDRESGRSSPLLDRTADVRVEVHWTPGATPSSMTGTGVRLVDQRAR